MIKVDFEGGQELVAAFAQLSDRVSRKVQREALVDAAEPMRQRMEQLAPRAPGKPDLADHIVISTARGRDAQEVAIAVGPSKPFFYGGFQEFGTSRQAAKPFMRPAFDGTVADVLTEFRDAIWLALVGRGVSRAMVISDVPVSSSGGGGLL